MAGGLARGYLGAGLGSLLLHSNLWHLRSAESVTSWARLHLNGSPVCHRCRFPLCAFSDVELTTLCEVNLPPS